MQNYHVVDEDIMHGQRCELWMRESMTTRNTIYTSTTILLYQHQPVTVVVQHANIDKPKDLRVEIYSCIARFDQRTNGTHYKVSLPSNAEAKQLNCV